MLRDKSGKILIAALVVLTAVLVWLIQDAMREHVIAAGDSAPAFTVRAEDGRSYGVPDFHGKLLVLNFWATWCPPCVQETPSLTRFAAKYAPRGVVVLGLSVDRDQKVYQAFLNQFKLNYPTARDFQVHRHYGTFMYPESYFIDQRGKVVFKIAEGADWDDPKLQRMVESLL
jgi:cytochrome c biogenesis protein CcmG, thiol:disulfide interchange protein DsbE